MIMIDPLYVVSGFGVGVLVGMTGVGGGSLMTPLLILLFGVHPATVKRTHPEDGCNQVSHETIYRSFTRLRID